ncbi:MAG: class I SAM-dependent methyltransferase [Methylacidiphilaceae bacterium]|nr:class I SAM-dependent methyltransferase [Candidatus Methylacidiphilaceae bacterium]
MSDCQDLALKLPGSWTYRRCGGCGSLWMDPLPRPEAIPGFYPENYYTHDASVSSGPTPRHAIGRVFLSIKLAILEARFGYAIPEQWWERAGGRGWARRVQPIFPRFPAGRMVRFLPFREGGRLLDVGCGNGEFLRFMRELGWEVEAIEPDRRAAGQSTKLGLPVQQGGIEDAALRPGAYDAITLSHVIEHLLDPRAALKRCVAALRPGGILVSISPNPTGWNARCLRAIWRELDPPRHLILPSPSGYQAILSGLPVRAEVSTSPMDMGFWWHWSRKNAGRSTSEMFETFWARVMDWMIGPILVRFRPQAGEEIVCVATKKAKSRENAEDEMKRWK